MPQAETVPLCPLLMATMMTKPHSTGDIACRKEYCAWWTGKNCAIAEIGFHMVDLAEAADRADNRADLAENAAIYRQD